MTRHSLSLIDRIAPKFEVAENGCWNWTAAKYPTGYGMIRVDHARYAHRVTYELLVGPIPEGLTIDHLCRNCACVNPDHLEPVTQRENVLRGMSPGALAVRFNQCVQGHEYTPANTYVDPRSKRHCRTCRRRYMAAYKARLKAERSLDLEAAA